METEDRKAASGRMQKLDSLFCVWTFPLLLAYGMSAAGSHNLLLSRLDSQEFLAELGMALIIFCLRRLFHEQGLKNSFRIHSSVILGRLWEARAEAAAAGEVSSSGEPWRKTEKSVALGKNSSLKCGTAAGRMRERKTIKAVWIRGLCRLVMTSQVWDGRGWQIPMRCLKNILKIPSYTWIFLRWRNRHLIWYIYVFREVETYT